MGDLYHVTTRENAELIKNQGFKAWFTHTEGGRAAEKARAILAKQDEELEEDERECLYDDECEISDEEMAREIFDQILAMNRRKVDPALPGHSGTVFFWSNPDEAEYRRRIVDSGSIRQHVILEVDPSKIPCQCYEADIELTDELFNEIMGNLDKAGFCAGQWGLGDEDEETEEFCDRLDDIATEYYRGMRPFSGRPKFGKEILCPCNIPKEAVVRAR